MDYNYVRMRNALAEDDKKAAEHYRQLYEKGQTVKKSRRWLPASVTVLLVLAAAMGTYILLMRSGDEAAQAPAEIVTEEAETPAIVTQPETEAEPEAENQEGAN